MKNVNTLQHTIYQITPTPIYKQLSNQYHRLLEYTKAIQSHENYKNNADQLYFAIVIGISLGVVLVTFLECFPGEPFSMELENGKDEKDPMNNNVSNTIDDSPTTTTTINNRNLEEARKKYDLSNEEITKILNKAKTATTNQQSNNDDFINNDIEDELNLTISQKINLVIYGSLIIGFIYVLNRDYDSVITIWFVKMFPKEAKTLGFELYKAHYHG